MSESEDVTGGEGGGVGGATFPLLGGATGGLNTVSLTSGYLSEKENLKMKSRLYSIYK